ncbi:MAG: ABC transporter ATP-binding protein [Holophagales bacterium]|nr:ABC transporter ATP-binding protein [Holophagales bacterium]
MRGISGAAPGLARVVTGSKHLGRDPVSRSHAPVSAGLFVTPALEVAGLRKSYGGVPAVDGVSFRVEEGTIVGLLGPNGAGKTTTVSIICGLLPPEAGEVRIAGAVLTSDTDPAKGRLGLVPQELALYEELSADDNLLFFGALQHLDGAGLASRIDDVLRLTGLWDRRRDRVKTYSGGMKRRLNLAAGLLHDPDVLLLDEPTTGVDPQSRNAIFESLEALRDTGKAILYTTHYMEEAERLCDRIVIVDHGRVVADGTADELGALLPRAGAPELDAEARAAITLLAAKGIAVPGLDGGKPRLEEVFLHLTGHALRDER